MSPTRARLIQLLLESAIPLLGFYTWGWNLYFILLFYVMDMLADELITYFKARDIVRVGRAQWSTSMFWVFASFVSLLISVGVMHFAVYWMDSQIDFNGELIRFWTYKELGIQQGYMLLPLVLFAAYQKYKMEYKRTKAYLKTEVIMIYLRHIRSYVLIVVFAMLLLACESFFQPGEQFYVLSIVLGVAAHKSTFFSKPNRQ